MGRLPLLAEDRQEDAETNQPTHFGHTAIAIRRNWETRAIETRTFRLLVTPHRWRAPARLPN